MVHAFIAINSISAKVIHVRSILCIPKASLLHRIILFMFLKSVIYRTFEFFGGHFRVMRLVRRASYPQENKVHVIIWHMINFGIYWGKSNQQDIFCLVRKVGHFRFRPQKENTLGTERVRLSTKTMCINYDCRNKDTAKILPYFKVLSKHLFFNAVNLSGFANNQWLKLPFTNIDYNDSHDICCLLFCYSCNSNA